MVQSPGFFFLGKGLQTDLMFPPLSLQQPRPDYGKFHAALVIENGQRIERLQFMADCAEARTVRREVKSVRQLFERLASSVFSLNAHRKHRLDSILTPPVCFDTHATHSFDPEIVCDKLQRSGMALMDEARMGDARK